MIEVRTNNVPRDLVSWHELPSDDVRELFDYVDEDERWSYRFVQYKGEWYDVNEFMTTSSIGAPEAFAQWHGYQSDSFYSGVLVRFVWDEDRVVMATYYA